MAKNVRYMTTKEQLSRFRNLTKGRLIKSKEGIENLLMNLPNGCKALSDDEKDLLRRLKNCYNDLIATWDYRSKELINQVIDNL